jgi:hypothetical protein
MFFVGILKVKQNARKVEELRIDEYSNTKKEYTSF